ncbi:unnamed protein product [Anisakis simplex]|uniref:Cystatin domain-containing protein n=1 Tax=Anisakis simplex TaxID=6269 RepID=A0A0M3JW67_ANISI|nr:unnamed protein product [Anisakis simplex]
MLLLVMLLVSFNVFVSAYPSEPPQPEPDCSLPPVIGGLAGGYENVDPNDQRVQNVIPDIMGTINNQSNSIFLLVPVKVLGARIQVVAGLNIKVEMLVAQSNCSKEEPSLDCQPIEDGSLKNRTSIATAKVFGMWPQEKIYRFPKGSQSSDKMRAFTGTPILENVSEDFQVRGQC